MARVVCRVHRSDTQLRASLAWSEGPDEFPQYHLGGQVYRALEETAQNIRETLGRVVKEHVLDTPEEIRRTTAYELALAGHELYDQLFWPTPEFQSHADDVRRWLSELRDRNEVESLEIVVDAPWSVPWNAVYDETPDESLFLEGTSDGSQWQPFWGVRYRLAASRGGGSPLRRTSLLDAPRVLLVGDRGDPDLQDVVADLRNFADEHELTFVDCLADLERELRRQRPDLLYWLSHAEPATLVLGNEEISANRLLKLLRRPGAFAGLAFLNCCGTAVESDTGSFLDTLREVGFSGLIGTEQITYSADASRFGLCFLEAFLLSGESAGEALRRLRHETAPLGLVYGTYCPPLLRVGRPTSTTDRVSLREEAADSVGYAQTVAIPLGETSGAAVSLPDEPYRGLAYFERRDRALLVGRYEDTVKCADLLDRDPTRFLLLHGESGVGKSSFLRAGLIPYLEEERVGYRFLRSRRGRIDSTEGDRESARFVRCTSDLFGQLAEALCDFCGQPLSYRTPEGNEQTVELPQILAEVVGGPSAAADLRGALHRDAQLLGRLLARLGAVLPFRLVTIIDQGEELYTLPQEERELQIQKLTLEMLRNTLDAVGDFKVILTLRTEFASRLMDSLRRSESDTARIADCLLSNLDAAAISNAVLSPTRFEKWSFSFEPGVPEEIAQHAIALQESKDTSILPLVQVVCEQLYDTVRDRQQSQITSEDWRATGAIEGAMERYVEANLQTIVSRLGLVGADRRALCRLFADLQLQRPDGSTSTALLVEAEAADFWSGKANFEPVLTELVQQRLVRRDLLRIGDESASFLSLAHDRLVEPLIAWMSRERKATRRGRAELRLEDRAALWNARQENRNLPSWWEWSSIRVLTDKKEWTQPQGRMMSRATRFLAARWGTVLVALLIVVTGIQQFVNASRRQSLLDTVEVAVSTLENTSGQGVPFTLSDLDELPQEMVLAKLRERSSQNADGTWNLPLVYAMAHFGEVEVDYLLSHVETIAGIELDNLVSALSRSEAQSLEAIRAIAADSESQENWRLKARLAILAARLGDRRLVSDMCQVADRPDPVQRTIFIDTLTEWHGDLRWFAEAVQSTDDGALRSAVSLAVGSVQQINESSRRAWSEILADWYLNQPDAGTHSAARWALARWKVPLAEVTNEDGGSTTGNRQRLAILSAELADLRERFAAEETESAARRAAWEEQLRDESKTLPDSLAEGLVAHYPLDEVAGNEIANSVAGQPSGIYHGVNGPKWMPGVVEQALQLHHNYIDCGDAFQPDASDEFSFGCWFLSEVPGQHSALIAKLETGGGVSRGFDLWLEEGHVAATLVHRFSGNGLQVLSTGRVPSQRWHHAFVTYDGTRKAHGVTIFIDGEQVEIEVAFDTLKDTVLNDVALRLGSLTPLESLTREVSSPFSGLLDDVRIYRRQLSGQDVAELYRAGLRSLAAVAPVDRSAEQQNSFVAFHRKQEEVIRDLESQIRTCRVDLANARWEGQRQWSVNSVGLTMLRMPAGVFTRERRNRPLQTIHVAHDFLLCDREISVGLFQQFVSDDTYDGAKPKSWEGVNKILSPTDAHPVQQVSWYDAAMFCNWLSDREGREACYVKTGLTEKGPFDRGEYDAFETLLGANGYRLPTEDEWEYACRAGTHTAYGFGDDDSLFDRYGVTDVYVTEPGGSRFCNAWGLFDMHGNLSELCQDRSVGMSAVTHRVNRGGNWYTGSRGNQSATQWSLPATFRHDRVGFRVALDSPDQ